MASAASPKSVKVKYTQGAKSEAVAIACFNNGVPNSKNSASGQLDFQLYKYKEQRKRSRRLLAADTPRVHYSSVNDANSTDAGRYLVGVYNPEKGSLALHDARLFPMASTVKAAEAIGESDIKFDNDIDAIRKARLNLVESFGGKRKRQETSARKRYMVEDEALLEMSKTAVQSIATLDTNAGAVDGAADGTEEDGARAVPPFNRAAEYPADAYPFDTLILPAEMDAMAATASALRVSLRKGDKSRLTEKQLSSRFVVEFVQVRMAQAAPANAIGLTHIKMLKYLSYLCKLKKSMRRFAAAKDKLQTSLKEVPPLVLDSMLERFCTREPGADEKYRLTTVQHDLVIAHVLVIALTVMDFGKAPVSSLAHDLDISVSKTKDYCKSIGCKIKLVARAAVAELTMPLEFPVRRRGGPQK